MTSEAGTRSHSSQAGDSGRRKLIGLAVFVGLLLVIRPGSVPPIWYDEGWVFSLAHNWVTRGHYGHLRMGEPVPAGIPYTGIPAVAPVALSFRLLGTGLWQGRLPGILFTAGGLAALYYVACRLYDRPIALTTLATAVLLTGHPDLHPVVLGRQALGEMPAMFFLLAGLACFSRSWQSPGWFLAPAAAFWALSLRTKPQVLPFLVAAVVLPLAMALWKRHWRTASLLGVGLAGTLVSFWLLGRALDLLLESGLFAPSSGHVLYSWLTAPGEFLITNVLVPDLSARFFALKTAALFGIPAATALCLGGWRIWRGRLAIDLRTERETGRLILWTLGATWFTWYLLFSVGWPRYLFPAALIGSVSVAVLLRDIAGGFSIRRLLQRAASVLKHRCFTRRGVLTVVTAVAVPAALAVTGYMLVDAYALSADDSVLETARYLNAHVSPDSIIETYDTELFFLLERSYHFPPDVVQNQLIQRVYLGRDTEVEYDPLAADPDYIVVGPMSQVWGLYNPVLGTGAYWLVLSIGRYEVYGHLR